MIERYEKELIEIKERMIGAEKFAEKLPYFKEVILANKITGEEQKIHLGKKYKDLCLDWGIDRHTHKSGSKNVTNYKKSIDKDVNLYRLYINSYALFDRHHDFKLDESVIDADIFFYDESNSSVYAEDHQLEGILEILNNWYLKAREENNELFRKEKLDKAKKEVERLEKM